jgi:C4-dicarboxylate-specific signal transduction histidine kinase
MNWISAEAFHEGVEKHELIVAFFAKRDMSEQLAQAKKLAVGNALCAQIDPERNAELMQMFGLEQEPALVIMREQVVLYAEACEPSLDTLETLIERVQALDMKLVRDSIEAQRAREALEIRNVCFTARRGTASN